jgi:hypothetical protein
MRDNWDADTYRERARRWQTEADGLPAGRQREACMALAEGYTHLVQIIEEMQQPSPSRPVGSPP